MKRNILLATAFALFFSACAGSTYVPEVQGKGAMHAKDAILYSLPSSNPTFKMKVESSGVDKDGLMQVSLYLLRKKDAKGAYLIPSEQTLILSNQKELAPTRVRANGKKRAKIALEAEKTFIQLAYALPADVNKEEEIQKFFFRWKIHVSASAAAESQTIRFNREDREAHPSANGPDPDIQYFDSSWMPGGMWW